MNKKIYIFFMVTAIFSSSQAKDLDSLLENYSDAISEKIEDKVKSINENLTDEIDKFGRKFIIPIDNDDKENRYKKDDDDDKSNRYNKKYYDKDDDDDDDNDD